MKFCMSLFSSEIFSLKDGLRVILPLKNGYITGFRFSKVLLHFLKKTIKNECLSAKAHQAELKAANLIDRRLDAYIRILRAVLRISNYEINLLV